MPAVSQRQRQMLVGLLLVLLVIAAGLWLIQLRHTASPEGTQLPAEQAEQIHSSFARGISATIFDESGRREIHLQADEQISFQNNITRLTQPVFQFFDNELLRWHVQASTGRILGALSSADNIELIELDQAVTIEHADPSGYRLRIDTEFLTIDPRDETLFTELPVRVTGLGFEQNAVGMRANLLQDSVTFFSNLEGRYHDSAH